jgi:hypothetical protein
MSAPATLPRKAVAPRGAALDRVPPAAPLERAPRALLHGALAVLRPGRLLALAALALLSALLAALPVLLFWDEAVAYARGPLLQLAPAAWLIERADAAGLPGLRAWLGPALLGLLWLPGTLVLHALGVFGWLAPAWNESASWHAARPPRARLALEAAGFVLLWIAAVPLLLVPVLGLAWPLVWWTLLLARLGRSLRPRLLRSSRFALGLALLPGLASALPPLALLAPAWLDGAAVRLGHRSERRTGVEDE